jgi:hypothetical protein
MIDIGNVNLEDTQSLMDELDGDMSTEDLTKLQLKLSHAMMMYTAVSSMIKAIGDCESGIARNMC